MNFNRRPGARSFSSNMPNYRGMNNFSSSRRPQSFLGQGNMNQRPSNSFTSMRGNYNNPSQSGPHNNALFGRFQNTHQDQRGPVFDHNRQSMGHTRDQSFGTGFHSRSRSFGASRNNFHSSSHYTSNRGSFQNEKPSFGGGRGSSFSRPSMGRPSNAPRRDGGFRDSYPSSRGSFGHSNRGSLGGNTRRGFDRGRGMVKKMRGDRGSPGFNSFGRRIDRDSSVRDRARRINRDDWVDLLSKLTIGEETNKFNEDGSVHFPNAEVFIKRKLVSSLPLKEKTEQESVVQGKLLAFDNFMNLAIEKDSFIRQGAASIWIKGSSVVAVQIKKEMLDF